MKYIHTINIPFLDYFGDNFNITEFEKKQIAIDVSNGINEILIDLGIIRNKPSVICSHDKLLLKINIDINELKSYIHEHIDVFDVYLINDFIHDSDKDDWLNQITNTSFSENPLILQILLEFVITNEVGSDFIENILKTQL